MNKRVFIFALFISLVSCQARTFDLAGCPPVNWTTRLILIALVAFAAALGGTYAGRVLFAPERQSETELHALLHSELDAAQEAKIDTIEQRFATRRKALESR